MTNQYTNLDKVELARSFPDIVAMKDGVLEDKKGLRGTKKGYQLSYNPHLTDFIEYKITHIRGVFCL